MRWTHFISALIICWLPLFGQALSTAEDEFDYVLIVPPDVHSDHWLLVAEPQTSWYVYRDRAHENSLFAALDESGTARAYRSGTAVKKTYAEDSKYLSTHVELADGFTGWVQTELLEPSPKKMAKLKALEALRLARQKAVDAKARAESLAQTRAAEEREAKVRAACGVIFRATADRKVSDLTVRETQQVQACQALGMYH